MKFTNETLKKVYFCTGARNHALLNTFTNEVKFEYDERIASFKALGLAKLGEPVAVCTTSGTAVSECVSAMLEAFYSEVPLVLITGDRPKKMHGTGAPQTIEHEPLTRACRGSYFEVTLNEYKDLIIEDPKFPIHINVLIDDSKAHEKPIIQHENFEAYLEFISKYKNPLFLFSHEAQSMRGFIEKFSSMGLPFYAESLSQGHDFSSIKTEKALIQLFQTNKFDCIVRIGHTPLSKVWRLLESNLLPVFSFDSRGMNALTYGEFIQLSSNDLLNNSSWWQSLTKINFELSKDSSLIRLNELMTKYPESELSYVKRIQDIFEPGETVYLGNSLVIRFFEMIQNKNFEIFGNRGVNGIDGQLSTAIGLAEGLNKTVHCILGDITTFYDLSALRELPKNLCIYIINNKGGRIFDLLKLDKKIVMEHSQDFENICKGFGLSYSLNNLKSNAQVMELTPDREQTERLLQEWNT